MRVRSKRNRDLVGSIVAQAEFGDVYVRWDDRDTDFRIARDALEDLPPERDIHLALLDALDRLRDSFNLAIECAIRDIQREMKKGD